MKVLVTGGSGFIGANLCRRLLRDNHEVVVLDDLSTGVRSNTAGLYLEFLEGSILDTDLLNRATRGCDSVIHLAALGSVPRSIVDPIATHNANATGTLNVLSSARGLGINHVVVASSSSVYGANPALPKSERDWVRPMSPYAVSKLATEQYALAHQNSYGMDTLAFRFFNVFGPWQRAGHVYAAVIPIFIDALLSGRPLPINGDGSTSRDFTFVDSVTEILVDAVERRVSHPEPVNLAFGTRTTLGELVVALETVAERSAAVHYGSERPGDVRHSQADNRVLMSLFPSIGPTRLMDGLADTVDWFREKNDSKGRWGGSLG